MPTAAVNQVLAHADPPEQHSRMASNGDLGAVAARLGQPGILSDQESRVCHTWKAAGLALQPQVNWGQATVLARAHWAHASLRARHLCALVSLQVGIGQVSRRRLCYRGCEETLPKAAPPHSLEEKEVSEVGPGRGVEAVA